MLFLGGGLVAIVGVRYRWRSDLGHPFVVLPLFVLWAGGRRFSGRGSAGWLQCPDLVALVGGVPCQFVGGRGCWRVVVYGRLMGVCVWSGRGTGLLLVCKGWWWEVVVGPHRLGAVRDLVFYGLGGSSHHRGRCLDTGCCKVYPGFGDIVLV